MLRALSFLSGSFRRGFDPMEQPPSLLLQRYRGERRKLLEFLLSSGLIKELRTSAGPIAALSDVDLDNISVDYVLHCIKSGQFLNSTSAPFGSRGRKSKERKLWETMNSIRLSLVQLSSLVFFTLFC